MTRWARKLTLGAVVAAVTLAMALPALALWTLTSASTNVSFASDILGAPQNPAVTTLNSTATLSWAAPSSPSGASFTYTVARTDNGTMMGSTCAQTLSATTCQDGTVVQGTGYTWTITAHVGSNWVKSTTVTLTKAAGALSKLTVTGTPVSSTAGTGFDATVTAIDASGDVETGYAGSVSFISTDGKAVLPATYTFQPSDLGAHTFTSGVTLKTAGAQTVTATDTGNSAIKGSANVTVNAASASTMTAKLGTTPQSATVNAVYGTALAVTATDAFGNATSGVAVTFTAPSTGASGTFANSTATTSAITNAAGIATATTFTANASAGSYTVNATSSGLPPVPFSLTNLAPVAGLELKSITTAGTPSGCAPTTVSATYTCTVSGVANAGTVTASVAFVTSNGTPTVESTSQDSTITLTNQATPAGAAAPTSLLVTKNTTTSTGTFTFAKNGNHGGTTTITFGSFTISLVVT